MKRRILSITMIMVCIFSLCLSKVNAETIINNVPVGKTGKISKYYAGKYSGGQGVWSVKDVIGGYDNGYYYEEAGAWAIERSEVNYKATTY